MHTAKVETGVRVFHKPSNLDISVDLHRSQHKNKDACINIIKDLLTDVTEGDIVYSDGKVAMIIDKGFNVCTVEYEDGKKQTKYIDHVAHTKDGYIYITIQRKLEMIESYKRDIRKLEESIGRLKLL